MKKFGIASLAAVAALVMGFGAHLSTPTASADVTSVVVVGCEALAPHITGGAAVTCDPAQHPLSPARIAELASNIGNEAAPLTAADLAEVDLADNQLWSTGGLPLVAFAFVNNQANVRFDATTGITMAPANDGNDFLCTTQDADCEPGAAGADGVVTAGIANAGAAAGATHTVTVTQLGSSQAASINIVGPPHNVELTLLQTTIQSTGTSAAAQACVDNNEITDDAAGLLAQPTTTIAIAVVTDLDGRRVARVPVTLTSSATNIARVGDNTVITVDVDAGIAYYAIICGAQSTGESTIRAAINVSAVNEDRSEVVVTVVGAPANVALVASPASIPCDGTSTSTVTATVTDAAGDAVANGVNVNFSVVALGTANPINTTTTDGTASSVITPLSAATAGVTVIVTSGSAQSSILVNCSEDLLTPVVPGPTPTPIGVVPPGTGSGGFVSQDGSAGFPLWVLAALALGSVALTAGGLVTRRVGR